MHALIGHDVVVGSMAKTGLSERGMWISDTKARKSSTILSIRNFDEVTNGTNARLPHGETADATTVIAWCGTTGSRKLLDVFLYMETEARRYSEQAEQKEANECRDQQFKGASTARKRRYWWSSTRVLAGVEVRLECGAGLTDVLVDGKSSAEERGLHVACTVASSNLSRGVIRQAVQVLAQEDSRQWTVDRGLAVYSPNRVSIPCRPCESLTIRICFGSLQAVPGARCSGECPVSAHVQGLLLQIYRNKGCEAHGKVSHKVLHCRPATNATATSFYGCILVGTTTLSGRATQTPDRKHRTSLGNRSRRFMEVEDVQDLLKQYGIDTPATLNDGIETTNLQSLQNLLQAIPTATARADVLQILLHKLIVDFAKADTCEAIVWGDSTTRLAEKTLAETAKGRGFALAWLVSDGPSPYEIDFYYPLRDLLKKEIHAYAKYVNPPLTPLVAPEAPLETVVSAKHSTIDGLMRNYFDAVEKNYPSIVANVVRTTAKFAAPSVGAGEASCSLCGLPLLLTPSTEEGNENKINKSNRDIRHISKKFLRIALFGIALCLVLWFLNMHVRRRWWKT
ncbi:hypothetical protein KCU90_g198, partial [Aureobasidium melanogenum]